MNKIVRIDRADDGRNVALIEFNQSGSKMLFSESDYLRKFLIKILEDGISIEIPRGAEAIKLDAKPNEKSFIEVLVRFMSLSFDLIATVIIYDNILPVEENYYITDFDINESYVQQIEMDAVVLQTNVIDRSWGTFKGPQRQDQVCFNHIWVVNQE